MEAVRCRGAEHGPWTVVEGGGRDDPGVRQAGARLAGDQEEGG